MWTGKMWGIVQIETTIVFSETHAHTHEQKNDSNIRKPYCGYIFIAGIITRMLYLELAFQQDGAHPPNFLLGSDGIGGWRSMDGLSYGTKDIM